MIMIGLRIAFIFFILPALLGRMGWLTLAALTGRQGVVQRISLLPSSLRELAESLILGTALLWAALEVVAVPAILREGSFSRVCITWAVVVAALLLAACAVYVVGVRKKEFPQEKNQDDRDYAGGENHVPSWHDSWCAAAPNRWTILLLLLACALIGWQCAHYLFGMHIDWDDSRFVVHAVEAWERNMLFTMNPATGEYVGLSLPDLPKDVVAPWPINLALAARLTGLHPTIVAHTVLPPIYLLFSYIIWWMIGKALFDNDANKSLLFVFFAALVVQFYGGGTHEQGAVMLVRIWQGKAALAAVGIPFLFYLFLRVVESEGRVMWFLPFANLGCCLLSSMSIALASAPIAVFGIYYVLTKQKWKYMLPLVLSALPTLALGLLYLRVRGQI